MFGADLCPCQRCNGYETGAWEDEEDMSWMVYVPIEYGPDPYDGLCCACGIDLETDPTHSKVTCPEPQYWS